MIICTIVFLNIIIYGTYNLGAYGGGEVNPCHLTFARETRTTNECVCLSRKCRGPGCQSSQGFVWYNYKKCPKCECIAPENDISPPKQRQQSESRHGDASSAIKPQRELDKSPSSLAASSTTTEADEEPPSSLHEWMADNSHFIIGLSIGACFLLGLSLFLLLPLLQAAVQPIKLSSLHSITENNNSATHTTSNTDNKKDSDASD